MKARKLIVTQAALATAALLFTSVASAALSTVLCSDTPGAEANGFAPSACAEGTLINNAVDTETSAINAIFQMDGDPFTFVGKYDKEIGFDETVDGYTLTVGDAEEPWDYAFQLLSDYTGESVDFALLVKQPEGGQDGVKSVAYLWTDLTLDIDGFFNSFKGDYSHVAGFIRNVEGVPEPGTLLLLGFGLIGLVAVRKWGMAP